MVSCGFSAPGRRSEWFTKPNGDTEPDESLGTTTRLNAERERRQQSRKLPRLFDFRNQPERYVNSLELEVGSQAENRCVITRITFHFLDVNLGGGQRPLCLHLFVSIFRVCND